MTKGNKARKYRKLAKGSGEHNAKKGGIRSTVKSESAKSCDSKQQTLLTSELPAACCSNKILTEELLLQFGGLGWFSLLCSPAVPPALAMYLLQAAPYQTGGLLETPVVFTQLINPPEWSDPWWYWQVWNWSAITACWLGCFYGGLDFLSAGFLPSNWFNTTEDWLCGHAEKNRAGEAVFLQTI